MSGAHQAGAFKGRSCKGESAKEQLQLQGSRSKAAAAREQLKRRSYKGAGHHTSKVARSTSVAQPSVDPLPRLSVWTHV